MAVVVVGAVGRVADEIWGRGRPRRKWGARAGAHRGKRKGWRRKRVAVESDGRVEAAAAAAAAAAETAAAAAAFDADGKDG